MPLYQPYSDLLLYLTRRDHGAFDTTRMCRQEKYSLETTRLVALPQQSPTFSSIIVRLPRSIRRDNATLGWTRLQLGWMRFACYGTISLEVRFPSSLSLSLHFRASFNPVFLFPDVRARKDGYIASGDHLPSTRESRRDAADSPASNRAC